MVRLACFLNNGSRQCTHFTAVSKRKENNYSFLQTTEAGGFCNLKKKKKTRNNNNNKTREIFIVWLCPKNKKKLFGGRGLELLTKNFGAPILWDRKSSVN